MGKYVIESKFENTRCFLEVACENREPYFFINRVDSLTPYTEPDLEQVKADWYKAGREAEKVRQPDLEQVREDAFKNGYDAACKDIDIKSKTNAAYRKGLEDAWEAARKIWEYDPTTLKEIFGEEVMRMDWFMKVTASEVIEKIFAYEQAQKELEQEKEEIKVGDEVNAPFGKAIVVNINSVAEKIWLLYADGHGGFEYFKDAPTKTGRHFEIAEILAKMKEADNG